jgi:polysaccharide biosynthesis protein PslA
MTISTKHKAFVKTIAPILKPNDEDAALKLQIKVKKSAHSLSLDPDDSKNRRGPFRPERLVSLRARRGIELHAQMFRMGDLLVLMAASLIVARFSAIDDLLSLGVSEILPFIAAFGVTYFLLKAIGLYRFTQNENIILHQLRLAACIIFGGMCGVFVGQLSVAPEITQRHIQLWGIMSLSVLSLMHLIWFLYIEMWRKKGLLTPNIVIVGATNDAQTFVDSALSRRDVMVLGIFDDRLARNPDAISGVPILGDISALLSHKIIPFVDQIIIAVDPCAKSRVNHIVQKLKTLPNDVSLLVTDQKNSDHQAALTRISNIPLTRVSGLSRACDDERKAFNKRIQDLIITLLALIVFAPVMLIIGLAIKLDSKGPIFFRQPRHGFSNEVISVWKFRSMRHDAADLTATQQIRANDDRVTRVGRFIRKTSLDELPQLFNVWVGEMSLVGPRPHAIGMKTQGDESSLLVAEYAWRHRMKPGMTGWAAIKGSRGPLNTADDVRNRVSLDIDYIERQSFWFDMYIMAMTIPCILGDRKQVR